MCVQWSVRPSLQRKISYEHHLSMKKLMANELRQEIGGGTLARREDSGKQRHERFAQEHRSSQKHRHLLNNQSQSHLRNQERLGRKKIFLHHNKCFIFKLYSILILFFERVSNSPSYPTTMQTKLTLNSISICLSFPSYPYFLRQGLTEAAARLTCCLRSFREPVVSMPSHPTLKLQ